MTLMNTKATQQAKKKKKAKNKREAKKFRKRFGGVPNISGAHSQPKVN
jgi:ribosomal protein S2